MSQVNRIYVEKKDLYATEAREIRDTLVEQLKIEIRSFRLVHRYDIQGVDRNALKEGIKTILSEPMVDNVMIEDLKSDHDEDVFAIEFLPGQYDQRADSCMQCFQILTGNGSSIVKCAKVFLVRTTGNNVEKIKKFLINPVDQRLASLEKPSNLSSGVSAISMVPIIEGFNQLGESDIKNFLSNEGMAMSFEDLIVTQQYFRDVEKREPTETELKVLDTYWSDHCRHTTFATIITNLEVENGTFKEIIEKDIIDYKTSRHIVYGVETDRPLTLMDLATISMKELRKTGHLDDLEVSKEINACSIEITVSTNQGDEQWLLMFKNETHNHPTEIEPFGGAATCLGGAIRDPLSGRAYVYQSMRITGAGDPRATLENTIPGKLPQRKICQESAHGFSSYGNQIGLTTGYVKEIYNEGYVAKRMELGAVVAAAPKHQVKRLEPLDGHIVLLIGGRTGRDGVGGATGSSKSHDASSIETAGAEVQKGNPVEERKIQRLFRNEAVSSKVIRCNDFGAGGVCVAVGELADGLVINLDNVLKKYDGLTGTEIAISESQERMAIVIDKKDKALIVNACHEENLEVVEVARVTDEKRLIMHYMGQEIVNISRIFLDAAGAKRYQDITIALPDFDCHPFVSKTEVGFVSTYKKVMSDLCVASQKGLVERFDSSIGNGTVLSPFGGKTLRSETEGMAALIPVLGKETTTASLMTYGYNPDISSWSPYHGAMFAIVESLSKIVAMGGQYKKVRFSFQEYFEKLLQDPLIWGKPMAALLGAYRVQGALNLASIGGKDSMSGSFEELHVPPTLVSFAVTARDVKNIISPELKKVNSTLIEVVVNKDKYFCFDFEHLQHQYDQVVDLIEDGKVLSAYTVKSGGVLEAVAKMAFGNHIGVKFNEKLNLDSLSMMNYGNLIIEVSDVSKLPSSLDYRYIGETTEIAYLSFKGETISLDELYKVHTSPLEDVYPSKHKASTTDVIVNDCNERGSLVAKKHIEKPLVCIPIFPGTNCEYDSAKAFEKAGAIVETVLIRNKTMTMLNESIEALEASIKKANIVMIPGGFSAGDEPEGSGKYIATVLRNPKLKAAIDDLLENRDGLMIGICNGFQALIKLGLLPDGKIRTMKTEDATLTFNEIGRHLSQMVDTRISSVKSPWLQNVHIGDIHTTAISHGEGRFVAPTNVIKSLFEKGQVFSQYVDKKGVPTMESPYNPNGSLSAIEGIISQNGRVIGKMTHSERVGEHRFKNIYGSMDQKIFEAGVQYFTGGKKNG